MIALSGAAFVLMALGAGNVGTSPPSSTSSTQQAPNPDWNCDDPMRQQEMNWCAGAEYAAADDQLNAQWSITAAAMKARDASHFGNELESGEPGNGEPEDSELKGDGRPGYFASLLEAQRAWLSYRDAHCRSVGYYARGGSMEPMLVSSCKAALTTQRSDELAELAEGPP